MIGLLIPLLARLGIAERFLRPVAIATTVIAVAALCGLLWTCWLSSHDKQVIADDRAGANVEKAQAVTKADREANAKGEARDEALAEQQEGLRNEAAKGDDSLAGPGTRAVLGRVRAEKNKRGEAAR